MTLQWFVIVFTVLLCALTCCMIGLALMFNGGRIRQRGIGEFAVGIALVAVAVALMAMA